jgi:hypothetical protein
VGARDGPAPLDVDLGQHRGADPCLARDDPSPVHDQAGQHGLHVRDPQLGAVGQHQPALVGQLAAALGVERRAVQHQVDRRALAAADAT